MSYPHRWVFNAWLRGAKTQLTAMDDKTSNKAQAVAEVDKFIALVSAPTSGESMNKLAKMVSYARVVKTLNQRTKRTEVKIIDGTAAGPIWLIIKNLMIQKGAEELEGVAPPGDLERKIQECIDEAKS